MEYTVGRIATLIGARMVGDGSRVVRYLLTDSRSLSFPELTLFFGIVTSKGRGDSYVEALYQRGVRAFVVEASWQGNTAAMADATFLVVENTLVALQRLAECHRDEFSIPIVGITGSNGKTMVKEWLSEVVAAGRKAVCRSPRSYNSQIGVPLSLWLLDDRSEVGIFEAGISERGEMEALARIIRPTIGVLTCIGDAHSDGFASIDEKTREKCRLFADAEVVIYDGDDEIACRHVPQCERLFWSAKEASAPLFIADIQREDSSTTITYTYRGAPGRYTIPFTDEASVKCSFAVAAVALWLGCDLSAMGSLEPVAMRMEVKQGVRGCTLINDSYNSDIHSLDIALDFMGRRGGSRRTLILSDIRHSAMPKEHLYSEVVALAVSRGVSKVIGVGQDVCAARAVIRAPEGCQTHFFTTTQALIASGILDTLRCETVLLKGARAFHFEAVENILEQRVHETILEVNLNAIIANLNRHRAMMGARVRMCCMVKADAYGAGAVEVARTLEEHHVDYLAVAVADEGVTLRQAGITTPIMVMNPEMNALKTIFEYNLEPEVYSFRILEALIRTARREGRHTPLPVHIKVDTGMHRLGFDPKEMDALVAMLSAQREVIPRSVFSHFVGSDSEAFDAFSARQYEFFTSAANKLQAAFSHHIIRHMANSAAISHFPDRQMDMCRLGIGLYLGASTLRTTILQLRRVPAVDTVGYSRRGVLSRDSVIAALPVGYADGIDRHLGCGRGYCIVAGKRAPYVGNICMDVALIDVTGIDCHEGDSVEIFGDALPVTVLSDTLGTIPYEVLTSVSNRIGRVYVYS